MRRLAVTVWLLGHGAHALADTGTPAAGSPADNVSVEPDLAAAEFTDETIEVIGAPTQAVTASTSIVGARDLRAVPKRNAEDALRLVPGVTLVQHGSEGKGHQFFLRGFDAIHGADLELTLEGVPINEWSNIHGQGYIDLGFIIPELIDTVVVTKGPFTLDQGAFATAGSAEYQLGVAPEARGWRAAYTVGTTNRHRVVATYSPVHGDGDQFAAAEVLHDGGFGERRTIARATAMARKTVWQSATDRLAVLGGVNDAGFELPGLLRLDDFRAGRVGFADAYDQAAHGRSTRGMAVIHWQHQDRCHEASGSAWVGYRRLRLLENYTGYLVNSIQGDRRQQQQATWSLGVTATDQYQLASRWWVEFGGGVRADLFAQSQEAVDDALERFATDRRLRGRQGLAHALVGLRWRRPGLLLSAGARLDAARVDIVDQLDADRTGGDMLAVVSPRVTLDWRPRDAWRVMAAFGRGFRPPEARAFSTFEPDQTGIGNDVFDGGAPAMTTSTTGELGASWHPSELLAVRAATFATYIARESVFDHVSGINLELNSTRRVGLEVEAQLHPTSWLNLTGDATMVDARFVASGRLVPLAPRIMGGLRAVATHPRGWRAGLRTAVVGSRPLPHGARGSTLVVVDATGGYTWRRWAVDLELENALNRQLREGEYHFASDWRTGARSELPTTHYVAGAPLNARVTLSVNW